VEVLGGKEYLVWLWFTDIIQLIKLARSNAKLSTMLRESNCLIMFQ
jgi:hypothetical protein